MEEKKEVKWCIVKDKKYEFYYQGKADYVHTITEKTIFNYDELPNSVKKNEKNEIVFLNSKKGLELLALDGKELLSKFPFKTPSPKGLKTAISTLFQT